MKGKVIGYNGRKGFGFIKSEDGTVYFVHRTDIPKNVKRIKRGNTVSFEVGEYNGRPVAKNVERIYLTPTPTPVVNTPNVEG